MKRLFLQIASFLAISTAASAADSTMVRFDFASTADQSGTYETTLQQGAQIIEYAGRNVLSLGNNDGFLDFGTKLGELIGSLGKFTITMNVYIPETTDISGNGNFIWCFANSSSTGYMFFNAKESRYAITQTSYSAEQGFSMAKPFEKGRWMNLAVVLRQRSTGQYYCQIFLDGSLKTASSINSSFALSPKDIGNTVMNYLGKSCYNGDAYLKGAMYDDVRIYNYDISARQILDSIRNGNAATIQSLNRYADSISIAEKIKEAQIDLATENLIADIELPDTYGDFADIIWTTSNANVITDEGHITRPAYGKPAATATLTATITSKATDYLPAGAITETRTFQVSVLPDFSDAETIAYDLEHLVIGGHPNTLYDQLVLPTVGTLGSVIKWTSSDTEWLSNTGKVIRQPEGQKKQVTLTATLLRGEERVTKEFPVTIHEREPYTHYLFVYFPSNSNENLYYAISQDGYNYTPLNNGQPFFTAEGNTVMGGLRDPHILRGEDGKFYMAVTDMKSALGWSSNRGLVLMKSDDLINWTCHTVHFPTKYAGTNFANVTRVWAPETIYDHQTGKYMVYFSLLTNDGTIAYDKDFYCYANDDFSDLEGIPTYLYDRGSATIDMDRLQRDRLALSRLLQEREPRRYMQGDGTHADSTRGTAARIAMVRTIANPAADQRGR